MADAPPPAQQQSGGVSSQDVSNANALNQGVSEVRQQLQESSDTQVALLNSIAAAITSDIIGGSTGANDNRILVSKGTGGRALEASATTLDPSTGVITGATWQGTAIAANYGGTGVANNVANTVTFSGNFGITITLTNTTSVTFPTSGTLATLNTNTWAQQQGFAQVSLTDAATISWNCQTQQSAYVLLTAGVGGTRALGAPTNQVAGFTYILRVQQSSGGSNALTYNAVFKWPGGIAPTLSTGANDIDIITCVSDGTNMYCVIQQDFS